jgi:glyoxylase-like metal-dependent hydrolase (beta-lactamase superfamily II)
LKAIQIHPESITDVFITHFHFDHVGGALKVDKKGKTIPTFPNADYWSNEIHYNWAYDANPREKASFLKENFVPLKQMKKLKYIDISKDDIEWKPGLTVRFVHGHTEAQMLLLIDSSGSRLVFCADLIPSQWHVRLPYIMAYDMQPMITLEEKERLLYEAVNNNWELFLEHDPNISKGRVMQDDRGNYRIIND